LNVEAGCRMHISLISIVNFEVISVTNGLDFLRKLITVAACALKNIMLNHNLYILQNIAPLSLVTRE